MSQDGTVARQDLTVHGVFERRVQQAPDAPAVRCGSRELSYAELDARAATLAAFLRHRGLRPGALVAVSMGRTPDLIVAMLAVLKAGGAYAPVEPTAPDALIRRIMAVTRPFAVLTHEGHRIRLGDAADAPLVCLDTDAELIAAAADAQDGDPQGVVDDPGADAPLPPPPAACVFFTSGSSGPPKGALMSHDNLLMAYAGWQEVFGFTADDRHLQTTTFEFDVFTADWMRALLSGGTLVMAERNFTLDHTVGLDELHALILAERITVMEISVLLARRFSAYLRANDVRLGAVRQLMVGSDKWFLDEHLRLQEHLGASVRVLDTYGVAEAGIDDSYFENAMLSGATADHPRRISLIGKPFPQTTLVVADPDTGESLRPGEPGEIWIGGPAVGRGYLADETPTAEHPRYYRTGDIGVYGADGVLEYLGRYEPPRTPAQTLWLARLEGAVREHPDVGECAVIEIESPEGGTVFVAYVTPAEPGRDVDADAVWAAAGLNARAAETRAVALGVERREVAVVVPLAALPRTRAGKIDRTQLPLPVIGSGSGGPVKGKGSLSGARAARSRSGCLGLLGTLMLAVVALVLATCF